MYGAILEAILFGYILLMFALLGDRHVAFLCYCRPRKHHCMHHANVCIVWWQPRCLFLLLQAVQAALREVQEP